MPCGVRYYVADIMRERPCSSYTRERVRALWGGSESLSHDDIARLPLPIGDRLWALWHLLFRLSPYRAFRVARLIALDILDLWDPPDIVVWFLGTGDEHARPLALVAAEYSVVTADTDEAAGAAAAARAATWASPHGAIEVTARAAAEAVAWVAAMKRYLSWVVKAFDPFTPVGGLL